MIASASITISHITDGLSTFCEYAQGPSDTVAPVSGWSESPPPVEAGQFMWRREGSALTKGEVSSWHAICLTGPKGEPGQEGPSGIPGTLGVNTDGSLIQVAGFDGDGVFGENVGIIYIGSQKISVPFNEYEFTGTGKGYIVLTNGNTIEFVKLLPIIEGSEQYRLAWKDFNSNVEIAPNHVIGRFVVVDSIVIEAYLDTPLQTETFLKTNLMELLIEADASGDSEQLKITAMAMGADKIFQVLVAQEGFIRSLWVNKLQSDSYSEDANGMPTQGFKMDGDTGQVSITGLIASQAEVSGTFKNQGFKTLEPYDGVNIPTAVIDPTIFKYSEMYDLIPSADSLQDLAGDIEGFSFEKVSRRNNQRLLLTSSASTSSVTVGAGDKYILKRSLPTDMYGSNYFVEWQVSYNGNMSERMLLRARQGESASKVNNDFYYSIEVENGKDDDGNTTYTTVYPNQAEMLLWQAGKGSGSYSGTYSLNSTRNEIVLLVRSYAWWGSVGASSAYLNVWTSRKFTGLLLVNGSTYKEIVNQPNAYYLSSSKSFTVGNTTQDSSSMKKYRSGTNFYDLFTVLPVGAIGSVSAGKIKIDGTEYTVAKLQKASDRITFWTDKGEVTVQKFANGTSTGVYTELSITIAILFAPIEGGVESMHILPINGANKAYDIGQSSKRFRGGYFESLVAESFNASSSRTIKKNIDPYSDSALELLRKVLVVNYQYKTDETDHRHIGFIAEDTPGCLTGPNHNTMSISDNIGVLIKAIQELDEKVRSLEAR